MQTQIDAQVAAEQQPATSRFEEIASNWTERYERQGADEFIFQERPGIVPDMGRTIGLPSNTGVLEVGCGGGSSTLALAEVGLLVNVIDPVQRMIDATRERASGGGQERPVRTSPGDVHTLCFSNETFGWVLALGILSWISSIEQPLEEMYLALEPGGYLIVSVNNRRRLRSFLEPQLNLILRPANELAKRLLRRRPKAHLPAAGPGEPEVGAAPSAGLTMTAVPAVHQDSGGDGQWVELPRRFTFTFASLFVGAVNFRCMTLLRPLGQPPYPLTPSLFRLLPEGVRALHISSQTISAKLPRISRLGRGICYVPLQGTRFFIDLNGSFEAYLGKFRERSRHYMKRNVRRFTRACNGSVLWREFRDATDMAEFHSLASEVSRKTYQHRLLGAGIDSSPSFREEMVRDAIAGHVRGYILFRQQTPIAYMFCRARCGDLVFEKTGFDPSLAALSPGFVLFWFALQRLFADGEFRRFDFGEGEYPHKAHLATGSVEVAEIYCFRWNFRNAALVFMHSAVAGAANLLRSALEALGAAQRLKKMIRSGIGRAWSS